MKLELGACYEFTLVSGATKRLRLLGGNPEKWQDEDCRVVQGDLPRVLGEPFTKHREVECWKCPSSPVGQQQG